MCTRARARERIQLTHLFKSAAFEGQKAHSGSLSGGAHWGGPDEGSEKPSEGKSCSVEPVSGRKNWLERKSFLNPLIVSVKKKQQ